MLGHDVARAGDRSGHELVLVDLPEIDITDAAAVDELLDMVLAEPGSLHAIVNCAAWTDVDGAESKPELAHAVNADGSEERRVGKECEDLCRSRWSPYH